MERSLLSELYKWKMSVSRKPLILEGARQVGKTFLLKEFAQQAYNKMAYISCDNNEKISAIFSSDFNIVRLIQGLSAITSIDITPGDTLIILDEIQDCPKALHALKYFCEDAPEYHIAVAGSLLGISLHTNESFPVGKVDTLQLFPMTFDEFLLATSRQQLMQCLQSGDWQLINALHGALTDALREYYFVGGMPAVVHSYITEHSLIKVRALQKEILLDYTNDFSKHAPIEQVPRIRLVWESIPAQLAKENKKFMYGVIRKGARATDFEMALEWLMHAGLVYKVCRVNETRMPLKFYEENNVFKLFILDVGLMGAMVDTSPDQILALTSLMTEYRGAFTELYVLSQLHAQHITAYYHTTNNSQCELDFVIQYNGQVIPIEVKAGENTHSKSLSTFLAKHPDLHAYRFSMKPYINQETITNYPLYAVGCLWTLR